MNSFASLPVLEQWSKLTAKLGRQLMTYAFGLSRMRGQTKISSGDINLAYRILTHGIMNAELEHELARSRMNDHGGVLNIMVCANTETIR